jgi:dihydrofolate reductase
MRTVKYLVAASLDGRIAQVDGTFACFGSVGDAHVPDYLASLRRFDTVLMGRKTYQVGLDMGVTDPYPFLESYVFSSSIAGSPNPRVHLIAAEPAAFVRELKHREGGGIYLCGGAQLASALLDASLVDEIEVKLCPLVIGDGIPLFGSLINPVRLELLATKTYPNGVLLLSYRVLVMIPPRLDRSLA